MVVHGMAINDAPILPGMSIWDSVCVGNIVGRGFDFIIAGSAVRDET